MYNLVSNRPKIFHFIISISDGTVPAESFLVILDCKHQWSLCNVFFFFLPPRLHPGRYIPPHLRNKDAGKNGKSTETRRKACVVVSMFEMQGSCSRMPTTAWWKRACLRNDLATFDFPSFANVDADATTPPCFAVRPHKCWGRSLVSPQIRGRMSWKWVLFLAFTKRGLSKL